MTEIGRGSGVRIVEDGQRLVVVDSRTAGLAVAIFVFALLAVIPGLAGLVIVVSASVFGLIPLGIGAVGALGLWLSMRTRRRREEAPLESMPTIVVIDLDAGNLLDPAGQALAPLSQVSFKRSMQLGSSSPALAASFNGRKLVIARGNPFAGGLGTLESALGARGLLS